MIKNKLILLIASILVCAETSAQTFEKVIHVSDSADNVWIVEVLESNNIILVGFSEDDARNSTRSNGFALKLDANGNIVNQTVVHCNDLLPTLNNAIQRLYLKPGIFNSEEQEIIVNGSIAIAGNGDKSANLFFRIDTSLNITGINVDTNVYPSLANNIIVSPAWYSNYNLNDSTYALMGFIFRVSNPNPRYILADSNLYLEIDKNSLEINSRQSFYQPQDSIYTSRILNMLEKDGFKYFFATGYTNDTANLLSPMYMLKVNSKDSVVKFAKVDPPPSKPFETSNNFMQYPPGLAWLSDTTFLYVTNEPTSYAKVWPGNASTHGDVHFLMYDTAFNLINSSRLTIHDTLSYNVTPMLQYDSVSQSYYYGLSNNIDVNGFIFSGDTSFFRLIRFDKNLNVIWDRSYRKPGRLYMSNITSDHNGNVIMTGLYNEFANPDDDDIDVYIIKVDSNGNSPLTVNIEESPVIDELDFSIYPNPASDELNFRKFNHFQNYTVGLYDAFGRLVKQFYWKEDFTTISVGDFASGVYIYRIVGEVGRMASGKIVVE